MIIMKTALLVEDMAFHSPEIFSFRSVVESIGFAKQVSFEECRSVESAKEAIEKHQPDLLLLDDNLNGGHEGRRIVRWLENQNIDVVIYSTTGSDKAYTWYESRGIPHTALGKEAIRDFFERHLV